MMIKKILALSAFAFLLSGCAINFGNGNGTNTLEDATQESLEQQFPIGKATSKDVLLKIGPPRQKSKEAGYETWQYTYSKTKTVVVFFVSKPFTTQKNSVFYFKEDTGVLEKITLVASEQ